MIDPRAFAADGRARARGLGLPFRSETGPANAITDVAGVEVGYTTLIEGEGPLVVGRGPVRTGVTVVHPRGRADPFAPVWAGVFSLNGNGEMTGAHWIAEAGQFTGPIGITNTHSVGIVHQAIIRWMVAQPGYQPGEVGWLLPVVAETCDAWLNDINGLHVREEHALAAIEGAAAGPVAEGNVGGGTGMIAFGFKGGTGTASRVAHAAGQAYRVGALVQANYGRREWLQVLGVPVRESLAGAASGSAGRGSVIGIVATDAPLLPIQLQRLARRAALGIARTGSFAGNGSGDLFLAFSTANRIEPVDPGRLPSMRFLPHGALDPLFVATAEAIEEAVVNALLGALTMTGQGGHTVDAIDHAALREIMRAHGRLIG